MTTSQKHQQKTLLSVLLPILVLIALVVGGLFFLQSKVKKTPPGEKAFEVSVGATLPDFTLTPLTDGKSNLKISTLSSKVTLVNFWATWCEACLSEMPSIVELRETFKDQGFEVVAINLDQNPSTVVPKAAQQFKMNFPVYQDPEGRVAELFDVHAIPLTVIFNHQRKILYVKDGEQDWNSPEIRSMLKRWLSE